MAVIQSTLGTACAVRARPTATIAIALSAGSTARARPVAEVDVAHEPDLLEHFEVAVGRGHVAVAGELLGAQRPVGVEQRVEQEPPRGR